MSAFTPRIGQVDVAAYVSGRMGVSAVPGSGKTHILSYLAADLIAKGRLNDDQEVLVVTLVNAAVDNFKTRIEGFIEEAGLFRGLQYRIRTLHGLAHDIVRERPELVGLGDRFTILDEREAGQLLNSAAQAWLADHPDAFADWAIPDLTEHKFRQISANQWQTLVREVAQAWVQTCKDYRLQPTDLDAALAEYGDELPLARMAHAIYHDYQKALNYRSGVDFNDLIRLAYAALQQDPNYLARLRDRWPYILEDEAQDSSQLQQDILGLLAGEQGNWVRVGDPNQAIYESFTTANPRHLREFIAKHGKVDLPISGRSQPAIIELANYLIKWTNEQHPNPALRHALQEPTIQPASPGDPQPNPPEDRSAVHVFDREFSSKEEVNTIVRSLVKWLPNNKDKTVAILVPINARGSRFTEALSQANLPYTELLQSTIETRHTAATLSAVLAALADPKNARLLVEFYRKWQARLDPEPDPEAAERYQQIGRLLTNCHQVEAYIWPRTQQQDWLNELNLAAEDPIFATLDHFRTIVRRWHAAALLPIDQLLLTIAQDLFHDPSELALAHKLATYLRRSAQVHPDWHLREMTQELKEIAQNERKFLGFGAETTFDPEQHKGKVTVTTMHKAKGLEWDRVYLTSLSTYDFPSAQPSDNFRSEKWFVRDQLNLQAEALAQLDALRDPSSGYRVGDASEKARLEMAAERLRLLFVGITRARRDLILTYNTGRNGNEQPALPFIVLAEWWKQQTA